MEGLEFNVCSAKIKAADAILIATPEYNYSIPGVLKNAIDWTSRPTSIIPSKTNLLLDERVYGDNWR